MSRMPQKSAARGRALPLGLERALGRACLAVVGLLVVALSLQRIYSADYWWQWKTGEVVARSGPPHEDTFSFGMPGQPRVEVRWLYCWALHGLTAIFGHAAATVVKTGAVLLLFGLAAVLSGVRTAPIPAAALVAVAALASSQRLVVRPETWSYLFVVVAVAVVARLRERRSRWVWALPVVQVLWVNVHGLFLLGPAIVGAWLAAESIEAWVGRAADPGRRRRMRTAAFLLAATSAACLANPYGFRAITTALGQYLALHGTSQKTFFTELRPTYSFGFRFTALLWFDALVVLAVLSTILAGRRQSVFWLLLAGSQLYLSLAAIRNVPLFCVVAAPFVARNLSAAPLLARPAMARWGPVARGTLAVVTIVFGAVQVHALVTNRFYVRQHARNEFGAGIQPHAFPSGAADFLDRHGIDGPVFSSESSGSYLIARGRRVFFDPRGDVYPDAFLEAYRALVMSPSAVELEAIARRHRLQGLFIDLDLPDLFVHVARREPGWRLVYLDAEAGVFLPAGVAPGIPALALAAGGQRWLAELRATSLPPPRPARGRRCFSRVTNPAPYDRLGRLLFQLERYELAQQLYEDALAASPDDFASWAVLGHMAAARRDHAEASRCFERAAAREPDNAHLRWRAGMAAMQAGDDAGAARHAAAALRLAPDAWEHLALQGLVDLKANRGAEAVRWLAAAIAKAPREASLHRNLAKAYYLQGQVAPAITAFETAFRLDRRDATVARDLARVLVQQRRKPEAAAWLDSARAIDPASPQNQTLQALLEASP